MGVPRGPSAGRMEEGPLSVERNGGPTKVAGAVANYQAEEERPG